MAGPVIRVPVLRLEVADRVKFAGVAPLWPSRYHATHPPPANGTLTTTNRDRLDFLRTRAAELQRRIVAEQREEECVKYASSLTGDVKPVVIDDAEWDLLLPVEQSAKLIPYFLCVHRAAEAG